VATLADQPAVFSPIHAEGKPLDFCNSPTAFTAFYICIATFTSPRRRIPPDTQSKFKEFLDYQWEGF